MPRSDQRRLIQDRPEQILLLGPYRETSWLSQFKSHFSASKEVYPFFELDSSDTKRDFVQQLADSGKRTLIIDLLAFTKPEEDKKDPVSLVIERTQKRLRLAQTLAPLKEQLQWLSLVPFGTKTPLSLMLAGATSGNTKSIAQEWGIWSRTLFVKIEELPSDWLIEELSDSCAYPELFYQQEQRMIPYLGEKKKATPLELPKQPVFVISGGGLGITASLASQLQRNIGNYRALILGRTKLPVHGQEVPFDQPAKARKQLKARLKAQLGADVTGKQIQEALKKEQRRAELAAQLRKLEAAGIEILYIPTDIQDASAVEHAVQQAVSRWGKIDGVIHGAGIDRSRNINQKTLQEVDLVLGVKLRGLQNLQKALVAQKPLFWLTFSSVSARFGNAGQFDYAAANDAMATWLCHNPCFANPLVLDYTGWEDVGMAATLSSMMKERGVDMLPSALATQTTIQTLLHGHQGEWVLSGRLPTAFTEDKYLGSVQYHVPGTALTYQTKLQTGQARYLIDHQILDAEVMPGVVSFLTMRRTAQHIAWEGQLSKATNIRFGKALKLWKNRPVEATYTASIGCDDTKKQTVYRTTLSSLRKRKNSFEELEHASAVFETSRIPTAQDDAFATIENTGILQNHRVQTKSKEIYQHFFHGSCWQVIDSAWLSDTASYGKSPTLADPLGQGLASSERWEAVGLELVFQTAGLWVQQIEKNAALPFGIGTYQLYRQPTEGEKLQALVIPQGKKEDVYFFDGILLSEQKQIIAKIEGLELKIFPLDL